MDPKSISILDYDYSLPEELIARFPLPERDQSKLLIYRERKISEAVFKTLPEFLPSGSLLVRNNTRVVEARLLFQKPTGGIIEIFCLEPDDQSAGIAAALAKQGQVVWRCLIGGASKWKAGQILEKKISANGGEIILNAHYMNKIDDHFQIELNWTPGKLPFSEILHLAGVLPLPPYMKRETEQSDKERYQTVFANREGSVAAPTAGLHFTPQLFESLNQKQIKIADLTLHVGAGTFLPVKSETMAGHSMHAESIEISTDLIEKLQQALSNSNMIIPIGTTSLRTLESLYWIGLRTIAHPRIRSTDLQVTQWEYYESKSNSPDPIAVLSALKTWMEKQKLASLITWTSLLIVPGYKFRIAKALVTNFHQPESTLLLLVAAFVGDDWRKIYQFALYHQFRFLSYGDGCLLFPQKK